MDTACQPGESLPPNKLPQLLGIPPGDRRSSTCSLLCCHAWPVCLEPPVPLSPWLSCLSFLPSVWFYLCAVLFLLFNDDDDDVPTF